MGVNYNGEQTNAVEFNDGKIMNEENMKQPLKMSGDEMIKYLNEFNIRREKQHESGVQFHTHQQYQAAPFTVEKSWGVYKDPQGTFKDTNEMMSHEVDLKNDQSGGIGLSEKD